MLERMFSRHSTLTYLENGTIFVDRDADVFAIVISYLRNGCKYPTIEDRLLHERFEQELDFWQLRSITNKNSHELNEIFKELFYDGIDEQVVAMWQKAGPLHL